MAEEKLPYDTSLEAEYEDGFVLNETALDDVNPFTGEGNTFTAILKRLAEPEHGPMVRFSVFWQNHRYDIDWTTLPREAQPIRLRYGYATINQFGGTSFGFNGVDFGFELGDQKEVTELR